MKLTARRIAILYILIGLIGYLLANYVYHQARSIVLDISFPLLETILACLSICTSVVGIGIMIIFWNSPNEEIFKGVIV